MGDAQAPAEAACAAELLLTALRAQSNRVIDIFLRLDEDMSGAIDKKEFRQVVIFVAKDLPPFETSDIDETFDVLDADGSGTIELKELDKLLRLGYTEVCRAHLRAHQRAPQNPAAAAATWCVPLAGP